MNTILPKRKADSVPHSCTIWISNKWLAAFQTGNRFGAFAAIWHITVIVNIYLARLHETTPMNTITPILFLFNNFFFLFRFQFAHFILLPMSQTNDRKRLQILIGVFDRVLCVCSIWLCVRVRGYFWCKCTHLQLAIFTAWSCVARIRIEFGIEAIRIILRWSLSTRADILNKSYLSIIRNRSFFIPLVPTANGKCVNNARNGIQL